MIKAVIFDMFETLITHFKSSLYFGKQIAEDMDIPEAKLREIWDPTDYARTIGKMTLEEVFEQILRASDKYDAELVERLARKRTDAKIECFNHLHEEILPMFEELKKKGYKVGLLSNCYFEEATVIKNSVLWQYFDVAYLSCEQGMAKPEEEFFLRCANALGVGPSECLYVGDGGSHELETAERLGMRPVQAVWYLQQGSKQPVWRKPEFWQAERPLEVLDFLKEETYMYERQYTRIDTVRQVLDEKINAIEDADQHRCAYVHLYGVGQAAAMLALKRGMGRKMAELAEIAGMLHDYTSYFVEESDDHAHRSAPYVRALLTETGEFTEEEIEMVTNAVYNHSDKGRVDTPFDEVLKDADALQHFLRNPMEDFWFNRGRVPALVEELGL